MDPEARAPRADPRPQLGTVFSLESEEDEDHRLIAEDSNDIYILTSDHSGQVSPPESLLATSWQTESLPVSLSASQSWHTESLPASLGPESWQQIGMDREEVKSLDSNGGGEERSENNSSNSDIVHVDRDDIAEVIEEAAVLAAAEKAAAAAREVVIPPAPHVMLPALEAKFKLPPLQPTAEIKEKEKPRPPEKETKELEKGDAPLLPDIPLLIKPIQEADRPEKTITPEKKPEKISPLEPEMTVGKGESPKTSPAMPEEKGLTDAEDDKPILLPEGKSILLYGGAAAAAILAVALGVALALRRK